MADPCGRLAGAAPGGPDLAGAGRRVPAGVDRGPSIDLRHIPGEHVDKYSSTPDSRDHWMAVDDGTVETVRAYRLSPRIFQHVMAGDQVWVTVGRHWGYVQPRRGGGHARGCCRPGRPGPRRAWNAGDARRGPTTWVGRSLTPHLPARRLPQGAPDDRPAQRRDHPPATRQAPDTGLQSLGVASGRSREGRPVAVVLLASRRPSAGARCGAMRAPRRPTWSTGTPGVCDLRVVRYWRVTSVPFALNDTTRPVSSHDGSVNRRVSFHGSSRLLDVSLVPETSLTSVLEPGDHWNVPVAL